MDFLLRSAWLCYLVDKLFIPLFRLCTPGGDENSIFCDEKEGGIMTGLTWPYYGLLVFFRYFILIYYLIDSYECCLHMIGSGSCVCTMNLIFYYLAKSGFYSSYD